MLSAQITRNNMEGTAKEVAAVTAKINRWVQRNVKIPFAGIEEAHGDPLRVTRKQYRKIAAEHLRMGESEKKVLDLLRDVNSEAP